MSIYVNKTKTYVEQFNEFLTTKKTFTVKFYKEYEGDGGYWDWNDTWVSGSIVRDTVVEKTFDDIIAALSFADEMQNTILEEEKTRYAETMKSYHSNPESHELYWMSEFQYSFHTPDTHNLIYAYISWCGSSYKMKVTYNVVEE